MAKVKILKAGYLAQDTNGHNCSNIILVEDGKIKMIIDPGTLPEQNILVEKLKEQGLAVDDINIVCLTHSHMDHFRNIGMFPKAKALDFWGWWEGDVWTKSKQENISENIKIIKTPGHSYDGITLLVKTNQGIIAICGDVFWKEHFPEDDPYASDKKQLQQSRKKILELADWIIPGHGEIFKV